MRSAMLYSILMLTACAVQLDSNSAQSDLPDIQMIERPADSVAGQMVDDFLLLMDESITLAEQLARLEGRDQYTREVFISVFRDPDLDPDVRRTFQEAAGKYLEQIDETNTRELKALLQGVGWRELAEYEGGLFRKAFLIVQHTPDDSYQAAVLEEIKPLAEEGLIDGQMYALMFDRVELKRNLTQFYGTQTKCIDGQYDVHGLSDPDSVDRRRAALGMEPLADYLSKNREYYGPCSAKD